MLCLGHIKLQLLLLRDVAAAGCPLKSSHLSSKNQPIARRAEKITPWPTCVSQVPSCPEPAALWSAWTFLCQEHSYTSQDCSWETWGVFDQGLTHTFFCYEILIQINEILWNINSNGQRSHVIWIKGERKLVSFVGKCWFIVCLLEALMVFLSRMAWHFIPPVGLVDNLEAWTLPAVEDTCIPGKRQAQVLLPGVSRDCQVCGHGACKAWSPRLCVSAGVWLYHWCKLWSRFHIVQTSVPRGILFWRWRY